MRAPIEKRPPYFLVLWCVVTNILALVLHATPSRITEGPDWMPLWPLISLFLWSTIRPRFIPPIVIVAVGLVQDVLTGGPMGVWAASYLLAMIIMRTRREEGGPRELFPLWLRFAGVAAITFATAWAIGSLTLGMPAQVTSILIEAAVTLAIFPLIALIAVRGRPPRSSYLSN